MGGTELGRFFNWVDRLGSRHRISYGDLHGGNVMMDRAGKLKICDVDGFEVD